MIQKGRSNNKSLYMLLGVSLGILAGAAYGAYSLLFSNPSPAPTPVAATEAPAKAAAPQITSIAQAAEAPTPAASLPIEQRYTILIKKSAFQLQVLDQGQPVESFTCALGKNPGDKERSGDMKTPNGTFKVIEVCDASYWTHDFKDGKGEIKGAYGPWFFYLDTNAKSKGQWDGIGIHGTHDPASMGTLASEGCIRVLNENCQTLKDKYIRVGTMVTIEE